MTNDRADTSDIKNDVSRPNQSTRFTGLKQAAAFVGAVVCLILAGIDEYGSVLNPS